MCGIVGLCGMSGPARPSEEQIRSMLSIVAHRGPDECGLYLDNWAALGHTRLSIIDLSCGAQPIHNQTESLWITYNGEIFNYPELRESLLQKGHVFYTQCDTEVLLHMYEEYGPACLDYLNGQFAFAIWDNQKKEMFLARDRVGIRPLYYTIQNGTFWFASEIKSLFTVPSIRRQLNPRSLNQIFTFWSPLPGRTAFQNIYEIPPGHYTKIEKGTINTQCWWTIPFGSQNKEPAASLSDTVEEMGELLKDAIRIRLRSDVPVGSYLSGGLDSSGITATIVRNFNNELKTFGIRFQETLFDEGSFQKQMVDFLGVNHSEFLVSNQEIANHFANAVWHAEKPLLRTAPVPLLLLSRLVRQSNYKVVLTGEGADEIFGGYNIFREAKIRRFWARQTNSAIRPSLLKHLYPYIFRDSRLEAMLKTFFGKNLDTPYHPLFSHLIRWNNTSRINQFLNPDFAKETQNYYPLDELQSILPRDYSSWPSLSKAQFLECTLFLSEYLLSSQGDRMAMANSVEIRLPFLDYRIMEKMATIPARWKIMGLKEKFLLKKIFSDRLPEPIVNREKNPYRAPVKEIFTNSDNEYIDHLLSCDTIRKFEVFNPLKVKHLLRSMKSVNVPNEINNMALTAIISTQALIDRFIRSFPYPQEQTKVKTQICKKMSL